MRADGSLSVTEHIRVRATGSLIRRGIYRDFPTRYEDRHGNRVIVELAVLDAARDGRPEPWFTESIANGVRINTGTDAFLPVPADYEYTLRYRTTRQLGFFSDHDELYWNELAAMPGPDAPAVLDAERYERLLPFAVALEVEDAWTTKFTAAVGAAAAAATAAGIGWYRGGQIHDLGDFSRSIGSSLSSQIASSATPPGSSSGSGGGGSSGGGGGGGGGGGR